MRKNSMFKWVLGGAAALSLLWQPANAGDVKTIVLVPQTINFTSGLNVALVEQKCTACHTPDYVVYQPRQDRAGWQAVLNKMRDSMNMIPLTTNEEANILDYLVTYYGK